MHLARSVARGLGIMLIVLPAVFWATRLSADTSPAGSRRSRQNAWVRGLPRWSLWMSVAVGVALLVFADW